MLRGWHQLSVKVAVTCGALLLLVCAALAAPDFPQLTGRVVDTADLLDAGTEASLTEKLDALEKQTTNQVVVVTLKSLGGETIETYGFQLGRHWGIGQKDQNNGALLIVAVKERKVRIEVGYGLEGTLTDALTKIIIDSAIVPRFKVGDFAGGNSAGTTDLIKALTGGKETLMARRPTSASYDDTIDTIFTIIIFLIIAYHIYIVFSGRKSIFSGSGRSSSGGWSSGGGGWSGGGGGFGGGGGSFGGGGSSGGW